MPLLLIPVRHQPLTRLLLGLVMSLTGISCSFAIENDKEAILGRWKVSAAVDAGSVSALDKEQALQLIGSVLTIGRQQVHFGAEDCGRPDFTARVVRPDFFLRTEFHADAARLGLPDPVSVLQFSCTTVFLRDSHHLVLTWQGWFFEAVKIVEKTSPIFLKNNKLEGKIPSPVKATGF